MWVGWAWCLFQACKRYRYLSSAESHDVVSLGRNVRSQVNFIFFLIDDLQLELKKPHAILLDPY